MATSYPTAVDTTNLTNPATTDKRNSPSHAGQHANANDAIKAVEIKLGTGSSTPAASTLLFGTGAGTSAWQGLTSAQLAAVLSDETGTGSAVFATTPTLVTPKVDTINESTLNNGVTVASVNLKAGAITTSNSVPTAAIQDSAVTSPKVATGISVQTVSTNYSAVASGTTIIPLDDTIPQITEGTEFMTQAITPKSATNRLYIEAQMYLSPSAADNVQAALFQDATANALAATSFYFETANGGKIITVRHDMVAGTTSSTTFRIRAGGGGALTLTINGSGGVRRFGGITLSNIKITEYKG